MQQTSLGDTQLPNHPCGPPPLCGEQEPSSSSTVDPCNAQTFLATDVRPPPALSFNNQPCATRICRPDFPHNLCTGEGTNQGHFPPPSENWVGRNLRGMLASSSSGPGSWHGPLIGNNPEGRTTWLGPRLTDSLQGSHRPV